MFVGRNLEVVVVAATKQIKKDVSQDKKRSEKRKLKDIKEQEKRKRYKLIYFNDP